MTGDDLAKLLAEIGTDTAAHVKAKITEAIAPLEARIAELEGREYQGTWSGDKAYAKGSLVTFHGSIWHSTVNQNRAKPGGHPHWVLAVRAGRDAKDPPR